MKKAKWIAVALTVCLIAGVFAGCAKKEFPSQTITIQVGASAGGSADLLCRTIAPLMEKELGQKVNVVNTTGASGGTAAADVMGKPHDGYNWFGLANAITNLSVLGAGDYVVDDWEMFMIAGTPGILSVRSDSQITTAQEWLDAMEAENGNFKLSAGPSGCPWHLQSALLGDITGTPFTFIPYQGSNPGILGCLNGEVETVLCGLSEQAEFLRAGKLRPLAVMMPEAFDMEGVGNIPSILDVVPGIEDTLPKIIQFNCFALPADTDKAIVEKVDAAFRKAMAAPEMIDYCKNNFMDLQGLSGADAKSLAKTQESLFCWTLHDLGLTQKSPEEFNIAKP